MLVGQFWLFGSTAGAAPSPNTTGVPGAPLFGISEPGGWRTDPARASTDEIAGLVKDIGASTHEFWVHWPDVEPAAPAAGAHTYRWQAYDRMYQSDLARGIKPMITVQGAPRWTWDEDVTYAWMSEHPPSPEHYGDWRAFLARLVERYPEAIGIQVWNEPNLTYFWGLGDPADPTDPEAYAALLKEAFEAIKAADPSMPVIGGALSNNLVTANGHISLWTFANRMLAAGAGQYMDGLGIHPYPDTGDLSNFFGPIQAARAAMAAHGISKPLWITEVGKTTTGPQGVSEERQAEMLVGIYRAIQQMPDVAAFFVHNLTEPTQDESDPEKGYGLVRGVGVGSGFPRKLAFTALRQEVAVPPPPPVPPPSPPAALEVSVAARPTQRALGQRGVVVAASCANDGCRAVAEGTARVHRRDGTIGLLALRSQERQMPAGEGRRLTLGFGSQGTLRLERALAARRLVTARLRVRAARPGEIGTPRIVRVRIVA